MQRLKNYLVSLGADHPLVHSALWIHGRMHGFRISFPPDKIGLRKSGREMLLSKAQYVQVPITMEIFDLFFDTLEGEVHKGLTVLDFSVPRSHRYVRSGVELFFPAIPEDDVMDAYTHSYAPKAGDIVWDVGAHAGATTYFLSKMVGPEGRVYAFEPDDLNYSYLLKNIELHGLKNVTPVKKAISETTGTAEFLMDGTMCAGLQDCLIYRDMSCVKTVQTRSISDACAELGEIPQYIKMDIEGAEVPAIRGAQDFLRLHPIQFAIESYHPMANGHLTFEVLEVLFPEIGYDVSSSDQFGQMFTWARPEKKTEN